MILQETPIKLILPIESAKNLDFQDVIEYSKDGTIYRPPTIVPHGKQFLCGEGHHRTLSRLVRQEDRLLTRILTSDREIYLADSGTFWEFNTLQDFQEKYELCWKQALLKQGIRSFQDYLKYIPKRLLKNA